MRRPSINISILNNKVWEVGGLFGADGAGFSIHAGNGYQFSADQTPIQNIRVANNIVWNGGAWTDDDCCGATPGQGYNIEIDTATTGVLIDNNRVFNKPGSRLWWEVLRHGAFIGIHLEQYGHPDQTNIGDDVVVRNNLIVDLPTGIVLNKFDTAANLFNNTILLPKRGYSRGDAVAVSSHDPYRLEGLFGNDINVTLLNNIIFARHDQSPDQRRIFVTNVQDTDGNKINSDYNLIYHPTSNLAATFLDRTKNPVTEEDISWLGWTTDSVSSALIREAESIYPTIDPLLSVNSNALMMGSPALNAGMNVGLPFSGSAPDMGFLEGEIIDIVDADMESLGTNAWTTTSAVISKSTATVRGDKQSLRVLGNLANNGNRAQAANVSVQAGEQYRFSAWAYDAGDVTVSSGLTAIVIRDLDKDLYLAVSSNNCNLITQQVNQLAAP